MNYLGVNIRHLRKQNNLSQVQLGDLLDVGRTTVATWEAGSSAPSVDIIIDLANRFGADLETFIKMDMSKYSTVDKFNDSQRKIVAKALNEYGKPKSKNLFVPVGARAGYLEGWNDEDLHAKLEPINIPGIPNDMEARTFEIEGASMFPILNTGDLLVCTKFEMPFDEFKGNEVYVIITRLNSIYVKLVKSIDPLLVLESKNESFPTISLDPENVREIWRAKFKITREIINSEDPYISKLETKIETLESVINMLNPKN